MPTQEMPPQDVLAAAYRGLATFVEGVDEEASWQPTGCSGWSLRDLVFHCLLDAQRGLVALHSPAGPPADRDARTYWSDFRPDPDGAANGRRFTRVVATMFLKFDALQGLYLATNAALRHAVTTADPAQHVTTQGHVLTAADLTSTLAVEATLHHLDLLVAAPLLAPPTEGGLQEVRRILNGLLGVAVPETWSDEEYARKATGRASLSPQDVKALGPAAMRFPLFA